MGSVVSESQSAFIKGKQILDGILIANEVVDDAKRLNKELLVFKVDFEKAYDSVDLGYLDAIMSKMNFPTDELVNNLAQMDFRMCGFSYRVSVS